MPSERKQNSFTKQQTQENAKIPTNPKREKLRRQTDWNQEQSLIGICFSVWNPTMPMIPCDTILDTLWCGILMRADARQWFNDYRCHGRAYEIYTIHSEIKLFHWRVVCTATQQAFFLKRCLPFMTSIHLRRNQQRTMLTRAFFWIGRLCPCFVVSLLYFKFRCDAHCHKYKK